MGPNVIILAQNAIDLYVVNAITLKAKTVFGDETCSGTIEWETLPTGIVEVSHL